MSLAKTMRFFVLVSFVVTSLAASMHVHSHSAMSHVHPEALVSSPCGCPQSHSHDDSVPADPCDSDDCQLCKFQSELGWLSVAIVEVDSQRFVSARHELPQPLYSAAQPSFYQGRAPPIV